MRFYICDMRENVYFYHSAVTQQICIHVHIVMSHDQQNNVGKEGWATSFFTTWQIIESHPHKKKRFKKNTEI